MPSVHTPVASQQPPQFCGPQRPMPWHWPPPPATGPHVVPWAVQLEHAAPLLPHAEPSVPGRQRSPTQHPLQLVASHFLEVLHVRRRASHAWPDVAQFVQAAPLVPQAEASVPERQTPVVPLVTQQPVAQLVALHSGTRLPQTFRDESQTSRPEAMQSLHLPPSDPQACTSEPTRQTPRASQHPVGHVEGPHVPASVRASTRASVTGVLASVMASSRLDLPQPTVAADASESMKTRDATRRTTRPKDEEAKLGSCMGYRPGSRSSMGLAQQLAAPQDRAQAYPERGPATNTLASFSARGRARSRRVSPRSGRTIPST